jgi:soluble lytic murein transglycosylase-like protein
LSGRAGLNGIQGALAAPAVQPSGPIGAPRDGSRAVSRGTTANLPPAALRYLAFAQVLARLGDGSGGAASGAASAPAGALPGTPAVSRQVPAEYSGIVAEASRRHGVDPALIAAVIETESGFNPRAGSPAGAKGLMQLMDATARGLGVSDSFDPHQNVMGGTKFLRQLLDKYKGDVKLALAAYNAGPGAVDRHGGIPPYAETQRYVPKVLAEVERYRGAAGAPSPAERS